MSILDLIHAKRDEITALGSAHGITNLRVFGSAARGDEQAGSDIDFLATVSAKTTLFDLMSLEIRIEDLLHRPVEISADDALAPSVLQTALRDAQQI